MLFPEMMHTLKSGDVLVTKVEEDKRKIRWSEVESVCGSALTVPPSFGFSEVKWGG